MNTIRLTRLALLLPLIAILVLASGCGSTGGIGSAIIVAGVPFETEAPVVTWKDSGGYDAYLERCHFDAEQVLPQRPSRGCDTPRRYGPRSTEGLPDDVRDRVAAEGFDLEAIRQRVDQFVIHYDVCPSSRTCFKVLHDIRGLSVHFLLDLDGTVYQTLDLVERGRQATVANDRSVGIEIAHIGAYPDEADLQRWYGPGRSGAIRFLIPEVDAASLRTPGFEATPARPGLFRGTINGRQLVQYDFTEAQYDSLIKLTRTLQQALPRIRPVVPRGPGGEILDRAFSPEEFRDFSGILAHWHVQTNKSDPGPAFDWDRLLLALATYPPEG